MNNLNDTRPATTSGLRTPVTRSLIVAAIYTVVVGVGIPVTTVFFPDSFIGKVLRSIPSPFGGLLWWVILLVPAFLIGKFGDHLKSKRLAGKEKSPETQ